MNVVEIRVPGVGGATAEEMLGERPRQVSGDDRAGFFVAADQPPGDPAPREVYEWGRLTSGPATSAGWWILLPFTLLNVAGWMFPIGSSRGTTAGPVWERGPRTATPGKSATWWIRLILVIGGGMLTALYLLWLAVILLGVVAMGCGADQACADRGPLKVLLLHGGGATWRVGVGASVTMAVWFLLLWYVQRSQGLEGFERDEAVRGTSAPRLMRELRRRVGGRGSVTEEPGNRLSRNTNLDHRSFWYRWTEYRSLWRWHLGASGVTLGAIVGVALHVVRGPAGWAPGGDPVVLPMTVMLVVATLGFSLASSSERRPDTLEPKPPRPVWWSVMWGLGYAAVGAGVAWIVSRIDVPRVTDAGGVGTGLVNGVRLLSTAMLALALALFVLQGVRWLAGRRPFGRMVFPVAVAAFAVMVAGGGLGSVSVVVGRWLLGPGEFEALQADTTFPETLLLTLVAAGLAWLILQSLRFEPVAPIVEQYFGRDAAPDHLTSREWRWVKKVRRHRHLSGLGKHADALLASIAALGVVVLAIETRRLGWLRTASAGETDAPLALFGWAPLRGLHLTAAAMLVAYVFPGIVILRRAFGTRRTRRSFAKVWDVLSFWPRRYHPFAAPSYAERAVPELRDRIKHHVSNGSAVILATHSQGTVIGYATLVGMKAEAERAQRWSGRRRGRPVGAGQDPMAADVGEIRRQLAPAIPSDQRYRQRVGLGSRSEFGFGSQPAQRRVAFVTYGSPLSQLYGRFFPSYFGIEGSFQELRDAVAGVGRSPGWRSFYRPTDYIGKRVFIAPGGLIDGTADTEGDVPGRCGPQDPPGAPADTFVCEAAQAMFPVESHSNYEYEPLINDWLAKVRRSLGARR